MASCKLLTVLLLLHNTGGFLGAEVRSSIIGGEDAEKDKWPWMVHLNITTADGRTRWRCGGTLLNDQWVLTAGRCWDKQRQPDEHRSMVWVGVHKLQRGAARYLGILYAIPHPYFQAVGNGYVNDIALIKLKKKVKFSKEVSPVTLASSDDTFGPSSECWITGWGQVGRGVPLPDPETLQQVKISIMSDEDCKTTYPHLKPSEMLCAGDSAGGKDACEGDYGGPLVCRDGSGFKQVGIMSYGSARGCGLQPGAYTRVSNPEYLRFINDYIHHAEEASTEV